MRDLTPLPEQVRLDVDPRNREHFAQLLEFTREIVAICESIGIEPVASGSLAVLFHTKDQEIEVHDVDLSCPESDFPRLLAALAERGIAGSVTEWHVLQARRNDLKVEFDSQEYWMQDLPEDHVIAEVAGVTLKVVGRAALVELYRRGLNATAGSTEAAELEKQLSIRDKLTRLDRVRAP
jgi:hypothetical protein